MSEPDPKPDSKPRQRSVQWSPATTPESKPIPPSSWAKKTGFKPKFSGETNAGDSGQLSLPIKSREPDVNSDLEAGRVRASPAVANGVAKVLPSKDLVVKKRRDSDGVPSVEQPVRRQARSDEAVASLPQTVEDDEFMSRHSHMKYELRDSPGLGKESNSNSIIG